MTKISQKIINELKEKKSITATIKTNQRKKDVIITDNKIEILIKEKPENNKANEEIEKFLTKITQKEAKIIKGKTSNKKIILFS